MVLRHDLINFFDVHGNSPLYHDGYIFAINEPKGESGKLKISEDGNSIEELRKTGLFFN